MELKGVNLAIAKWLIEALKDKDQVPKTLIKPWIEQEQQGDSTRLHNQ
ncbi:MAG: hypothetical protein AAGF83_01280 [Cyanobacteria bacterium P01_G01_bin.67]